ncbi:sigma-70 family RNA polymerase sigma factor [Candidatus Poribacteria bacterium]|nr:sigma-70 family RNA polymerase sigma factor [Candidatus Poribacteria bacterium]
MKENDVQLIHRVLSGDDEAFSVLVEKYRRSVHALAWRKVGDFHFAEEITQDAFLQVYKKLSTLRNPNHFAGWLYVITNRLCKNWHRKSKSAAIQSLETISKKEIDEFSYKCYELEQRENEVSQHRTETVKRLLEKLPESERTVVILYYLGEMTAKEIGNFLGVSVNTIKSRLQRARKRLEMHNEELSVRETFGSVQLPPNLTENIMRQVADLKLTPPQVGKPLLPWAAFGAAVLLITLMLGTHHQYLARFQQPYSFEAQSEPTVEIIDAPITLPLLSKPAVQNQVGRTATLTKNNGIGLQTSETAVTTTTTAEFPATFSTSQWTQMGGPAGGVVFDIFETSKRTLYLNSAVGVHRLTAGTTVWTPVDINIPNDVFRVPIAEHADTLYMVSTDELLASTDDGETWNALGTRPEGDPAELIVIGAADRHSAPARVTMYLALLNRGVFRSTDAGKHWTPANSGLTSRKIYKLAAIGNTVFAGTDKGLYRLRLNADGWEQLQVDATRAIYDLVAFEDNLYVGTGHKVTAHMRFDPSRAGRVFKSNNLGISWTEITPKDENGLFMVTSVMPIAVKGETILVRGDRFRLLRSTDAGITWTDLGAAPNTYAYLAADENTFYKTGIYGLYRTTDAGESWHHFMEGIVGTGVQDLVVFNDRFYVQTGNDIVESDDNGKSWTRVQVEAPKRVSHSESINLMNKGDLDDHSKFVVVDNLIYTIVPEPDNLRISYLSAGNNTFVPVQGVPIFGEKNLSTAVWGEIAAAQGLHFSGDRKKDRQLLTELRMIEEHASVGAFAVSDGTFYVEYKRKLFKWQLGDPEWKNTGLIDTGPHAKDGSKNGFKLAISAETVYVGKRDGRLFQSLDAGESWRDITPSLPLRFTQFNEIVFVDSTAYVATDRGVLTSQTGAYWRVLTDTAGERIVIDRFAVDGTSVYGAGDAGVYRLDDRGQSEQIFSSVPDKVLSLAVKSDKLYIVTKHNGMFQIPLAEEGDNLSRR